MSGTGNPVETPNDVTRQICNAWKSDNLIKKIVCNSIIGECVSKVNGLEGR